MVVADTESVDNKVESSDTGISPPPEIVTLAPGEIYDVQRYDGEITRMSGSPKIYFRKHGQEMVGFLIDSRNVRRECIYCIKATNTKVSFSKRPDQNTR